MSYSPFLQVGLTIIVTEIKGRSADDCFWGEKSDHLRAELSEADQDYNSISDSDENNPSTISEPEDDAPLQSVTKLPHLKALKSLH